MKMQLSDTRQDTEQVVKPAEKPVYECFKRIFDVVFSLIALVLLAIPLLIVSLIIVIDAPGASPIYVQTRVGKNGRTFRFYKFRSMVPKADELLPSLLDQNEMVGPVFKMKDDPRITRFGRFIRRTSIDELPQLINILRGEMSFVGPRPPLPREVEAYTPYQQQRLCITPGLTCYWQVQPGRNDIPFDEWVALDLKYIQTRSCGVDIAILLKTVGAVWGMEGV